ncbi:YtxH domain-containing protein [Aerococcaceae bacterium WGS1372]
MSNNNKGFFLGALFGASIAGITALLYAPKSGKELRRDIALEVDQLLENASEYTDYAVERGVELYDTAYETKEDIKVNLKESADTFKSQLDDFRHEASNEWEKVRTDLKQSKNELKDEAEDFGDTVSEEASKLSSDVKKSASNVKDSAEEAADNIKDSAEDAVDDVRK